MFIVVFVFIKIYCIRYFDEEDFFGEFDDININML